MMMLHSEKLNIWRNSKLPALDSQLSSLDFQILTLDSRL